MNQPKSCPNCGCADFEEDEGQWFCADCQTQATFGISLRDDDDFGEETMGPMLTEQSMSRKRKVSTNLTIDDTATSWSVFSRILAQQCDILVSLGFPDPVLHTTVIRLYLQVLAGSGVLTIENRSDPETVRSIRTSDAFLLNLLPSCRINKKILGDFSKRFRSKPVEREQAQSVLTQHQTMSKLTMLIEEAKNPMAQKATLNYVMRGQMFLTIYLIEQACSILNIPFLPIVDVRAIDESFKISPHKFYSWPFGHDFQIEFEDSPQNAAKLRALTTRLHALQYRNYPLFLEGHGWCLEKTLNDFGAFSCMRSMVIASVASVCDFLKIPRVHCLSFVEMLIEKHRVIEKMLENLFLGCKSCPSRFAHRLSYQKTEIAIAFVMVWFLYHFGAHPFYWREMSKLLEKDVFKPIDWVCHIRVSANRQFRNDCLQGRDPFRIAKSSSHEWRFERKKDYKLRSSNCLFEMAREVKELSRTSDSATLQPAYKQLSKVMTLGDILRISTRVDPYLIGLNEKGGPVATVLCYLFHQLIPIPAPYIHGSLRSGVVFKAASQLLEVSFEKVNRIEKYIWETLVEELHVYGVHCECVCLLRAKRMLKSRCVCKENTKRGKRAPTLLF